MSFALKVKLKQNHKIGGQDCNRFVYPYTEIDSFKMKGSH